MTTETTEDNKYATHATGTAGISLGTIGTVLGGIGVLGAGSGLFGGWNNRQNQPQWVSKEEYAAGQQIAAKDSEIALLKSENDSEKKMIDVYKTLAEKINALNDKLNADNEKILTRTDGQYMSLTNKIDTNKSAQDAVNMGQVGFNAKIGSDMECVKNRLHDISRYSVPFWDVTKPAINPLTSYLSAF